MTVTQASLKVAGRLALDKVSGQAATLKPVFEGEDDAFLKKRHFERRESLVLEPRGGVGRRPHGGCKSGFPE